MQQDSMPSDIVLKTLLYSDIFNVINMCNMNTSYVKLCDDLFWHKKFSYDILPLKELKNTFTEWVKLYITTKNAKQEAQDLIKIYRLYHYKPISIDIDLGYNAIYILSLDLIEAFSIYENDRVSLMIHYNNEWQITYNEHTEIIHYNTLISIITLVLMHYKKLNLDIIGVEKVTLIYEKLLTLDVHNIYQKTFLMGYRLLDEYKCKNIDFII